MSQPGWRAARWLMVSGMLTLGAIAWGWADDGLDGRWRHSLHLEGRASSPTWTSDVRAHWKQRAPADGWPPDGVMQRFESCLRADAPRQLRLRVGADDEVALVVNDVVQYERFGPSRYTETVRAVTLAEGVVSIEVRSRDLEASHSVQLWVEGDDGDRTQLPMRWLQRPPCR